MTMQAPRHGRGLFLGPRTVALIVAALIAGLALGIGALSASATTGSSSRINACVAKDSGVMRMVSGKDGCRDGEFAVAWNVQGPQGLQGIQGPQGPAGDFSGNFISPNGLYSLSVTDAGIVMQGPASKVVLNGSGIEISGAGMTRINGGMVLLNCGTSGSGAPVAKAGSMVAVSGNIGFVQNGSNTVLTCG
jgi:hypothetical protein